MVFDFSKEKRNFPFFRSKLKIDNIEVERVNSAKILGVMIQNNMNWWKHVTKIVKKAGKRLYMLRLLKRANADTKALSTVYITVIYKARFGVSNDRLFLFLRGSGFSTILPDKNNCFRYVILTI